MSAAVKSESKAREDNEDGDDDVSTDEINCCVGRAWGSRRRIYKRS